MAEEKVLQLEKHRLTAICRPFDSGYKSGRRHSYMRVRLMVDVEEGGESHVGELAVLAIGNDTEELLQDLRSAFACSRGRHMQINGGDSKGQS